MHPPRSVRLVAACTRASCRLCLALLLLVTACKDTSAPAPNLVVTPDQIELEVGTTRQLTATGGSGQVTWSTSDPNVADVVTQTGFVTATGRGSATITATSGVASASVQVTVLAPPTLQLSAAALTFDMVVGGAVPAAQTVTVSNAGDGVLANVAPGTIAYGAGQPTGWLAVTASGNTAPVTITFTPNTAGLTHGTFTAVVPVVAAGIANSPQNVAVTFRLQRPPGITVNPTSVSLSGIPDVTVTETVSITNAGDLPLTGLSQTIAYSGGAQGWLSGSLSATTAPSTLTLTANTAGLAPATYTATVLIASSVSGVAARNVPVTLVVTTGPTIQLTPSTVSANTTFGGSPSPINVAVTNGGGGTVSGLSIGTITYGTGQPGGWLSASTSSSTAPATITLTFNSSTLASGTYTAIVPVISSTAGNSPVNLPVTLTVGPLPVISLSPGSVQFATWAGAGTLPGTQVVQITNAESGALTGLSGTLQYTSGSTGWLNATLSSSVAPAQLTLRPNTTGLPAGQHTAVITIHSSMDGVASQSLTVTYVVQSFTVDVYPHFSNCTGCHTSGGTSPSFSGTATQVNSTVQGYLIPGNASGSLVVCKPFGACTHSGGKNFPAAFNSVLSAWINAGAPFQ